ncbi:MAG TPA: ion channel [Caldisericia bacterium]|nr:ion channel [Caldisericia bacterium]HPF49440.1 ion channel [Caldisericia bacterium]HPI84356.1 ion channel [Caldisericia bacterium]HPQ93612.1 ion channel [Caldisericia bacterium]HRV75580.1 ion channel [Caldisericia bacterium]
MAPNFHNLKSRIKQLFWLTSAVVAPIVVISAATYIFESGAPGATINSFWDALWWAIVTMSTLGYGNLVPVTPWGKVMSVVAIISGIILVALLTATLVARLVERLVGRMNRRIPGRLSEHVLILGWNENGSRIVSELMEECKGRSETIVVMADRDWIDNLPQEVIFIQGDTTRLSSLEKVAADKAKTAVVLADLEAGSKDTDSRVILTVLALNRISNGSVRIICEVLSSEDLEYLEGAGADEIVVRSEVAGDMLSRAVHNPGLASLVSALLTNQPGGKFKRIKVSERFTGMKYDEFLYEIRKTMQSLPVALIRKGQMFLNPDSETIIEQNDEVFVISDISSCG